MRLSVRFLKEVDQLEAGGKVLGPFEAGERSELWSWEAELFEEEGVAEVDPITATEIRKRLLAEEMSGSLQQLPAGFYAHVRHTLKALARRGEEERAKELSSLFRSLLSARLMKLLKFVLSPEEAQNLLPEEKFLVNQLSLLVESWLDEQGRISAGEEVSSSDGEKPV